MHRKLALSVCLVAVAVASAATSSQATVSGRNGLIVFHRLVGTPSHTCNPCSDLFTIRANGTGLRQVTTGKSSAHAAWAPDGKHVVLEHGPGNAILDVRSGRIRLLKAGLFPAFSPDGKTIAYAHGTRDHYEGVWLMNVNGRDRRYLPNADGCSSMAFSPDGKQLACGRKGALFVVNVDGSGRIPIVRQKLGVAGHVDWSPDGSRIIFHIRDRLFTIAPDGSGMTQLTRRGQLCPGSFSPDGTKILVLGNCESETDSYLLTMNIDGSGLKRIPNTKGAHWASWGRQP